LGLVLVLVIDTSSAAVTAAVVEIGSDGGQRVALRGERVTLNARGHGEHLAPNVAGVLADAGARPADLAAIVAGTGPGPYTGLRVGLVTAAVLGETLGVPTYGVCSLDGIGAATSDEPALLVATDARRKEVYWARYAHGVRVDGPSVARPADVPRDAVGTVAGQGGALYDFGLPLLERRYPSALALGRAAAGRIRAGAPSEPLTPLYLRRPDVAQPHAAKAVSQ
jgi:tRNA threonylcarbamoyl adenosine modification protein YeaZ